MQEVFLDISALVDTGLFHLIEPYLPNIATNKIFIVFIVPGTKTELI